MVYKIMVLSKMSCKCNIDLISLCWTYKISKYLWSTKFKFLNLWISSNFLKFMLWAYFTFLTYNILLNVYRSINLHLSDGNIYKANTRKISLQVDRLYCRFQLTPLTSFRSPFTSESRKKLMLCNMLFNW